ncbi:MAG TPA: hypothetical protein VLS89_05600, partial [Candidatus Nanopelagicales bacterium]|nr:hypothetical protein [Candidatus Nanopelagicales bacterium]
ALQSAVGVAAPEPEVRKADRREDRAVRAIFRLVEAWEELEGEIPQGALGAKIRQRLFGKDKLSFLTLQPRAEWAVVETKLGVIQSEGLEAELDQLGAMPMLQHLRQVHALYGEVTGATRAAAPTSPQVRERLDALLDSIKHYVAAVVGSVKRKDPATKALADRVLKPLADWESKAPSGGGGSSPDEGAPGAGGG